MATTIRRPQASELAQVQALVQRVVDETYGGQWAEPPVSIAVEDWTKGWAAIVDDEIVGVVLSSDDWIADLWVAREARRQGIGAALLDHGVEDIADRGYKIARLRVVASNTRAHAFYTHRGWRFADRYPHPHAPIEMIELAKPVR